MLLYVITWKETTRSNMEKLILDKLTVVIDKPKEVRDAVERPWTRVESNFMEVKCALTLASFYLFKLGPWHVAFVENAKEKNLEVYYRD